MGWGLHHRLLEFHSNVHCNLIAEDYMSIRLKPLTAAMVAGGLMAGAAAASAEISGNVALTTDYVWRGVSQTNEDPAVQGGLDFAHESGIYVGTWGSNVDFGSVEHMELDLYGGIAKEFGDWGIDVGFIRYMYFSDTNDIDFTELYAGVSYGPFSAKISNDFDNDNLYMEAGADFELASGFGIGLHIGKYDFDGGADYVDYSLGVSKEVGGVGLGLTYYATNGDGEDLFGEIADGRIVFTVSKSI
jgi:uncharacterized protein (TIGR02001 family)